MQEASLLLINSLVEYHCQWWRASRDDRKPNIKLGHEVPLSYELISGPDIEIGDYPATALYVVVHHRGERLCRRE